jgi:spore coat protein A, manganese oxidase
VRSRIALVIATASVSAAAAAAVPATAGATHEPFAAKLPIPEVVKPKRDRAKPLEIEMREAKVPVLPGPKTRMWTYDGSFPGPTIRARSGRSLRVRFENELPPEAGEMSVHLHGGHTPSLHDGQPSEHLIAPGEARTYEYPLVEDGAPERAATQWYHDHRDMRTAENVWRGLAGMFILDDAYERDLALPRGRYDVPLMLADRQFDERNQLVDPFPEGGPAGGENPPSDDVTGDHLLVNGAPQPRFGVADRTYRLRLLNASNFRTYDLRLSDGSEMTQIGTESGLLPAPVNRDVVRLGPAERADVLVDFNGSLGERIELRDATTAVMQFRVNRRAKRDSTQIPFDTLRPAPSFGPAPLLPDRTWDLATGTDPRNGRPAWTINGRVFDHARIDARPVLSEVEHWRITNNSTVQHVMHPHSVDWRLISRDGQPPEPWEDGLKESFLVDPGETVVIASRFTEPGKFVFHCHMLEHEDNGMMANFEVIAGGGGAASWPAGLFIVAAGLAALAPLALRALGRFTERELRFAGAAALAGVALAHSADLAAKVSQAPYLAVSFAVLIAASAALAWALVANRRIRLAWTAGATLAALALAGYVVSRSVGLPGIEDHVGHWLDPAGAAAIFYELAFVLLAARSLAPRLHRLGRIVPPARLATGIAVACLLVAGALASRGADERPSHPAHLTADTAIAVSAERR